MEKSLCDNKKCPNFGKYDRYCNHSTLTIPEIKAIDKVSDSRKEDEKKYKKVRKQYLKDFPECEANLPGCKKKSSEIHHKRGRIGGLLYDVRYFLACCNSCHRLIEANSLYARKAGLSLSRLTPIKRK